jgi:hypothetical protein
MAAHCRTVAGAMHERALSTAQLQELAELAAMTVFLGVPGPAVSTLICERMSPRNDLRDGRHATGPQASAANHQVA